MSARSYTYAEILDLPASVGATQAAAIVGVGRSTIVTMARDGRVHARKVGGRWRFSTAELLRDFGMAEELALMAGIEAERERGVVLLAALGSHVSELEEVGQVGNGDE